MYNNGLIVPLPPHSEDKQKHLGTISFYCTVNSLSLLTEYLISKTVLTCIRTALHTQGNDLASFSGPYFFVMFSGHNRI